MRYGDIGSSVRVMRCPVCTHTDDKVVDSRLADDGEAIRRRRECLSCGRRFTTFERVEEAVLVVTKRGGDSEPFDRGKLVAGMCAAAKNRIPTEDIELAAAEIEEDLRLHGPEVQSERIGRAVLDYFRDVDDVAYMRFASVYKGFENVEDFAREVDSLTTDEEDVLSTSGSGSHAKGSSSGDGNDSERRLTKTTAPKQRA